MQYALQETASKLGVQMAEMRAWKPHIDILVKQIIRSGGNWGTKVLSPNAKWDPEFLVELPDNYDESKVGTELPAGLSVDLREDDEGEDWVDEPRSAVEPVDEEGVAREAAVDEVCIPTLHEQWLTSACRSFGR